jgi:hypothetical protein
MICNHDHDGDLPKSEFDKLPMSQRGRWRHVCAGCAYQLGRLHGEEAAYRLRERVRALEQKLMDVQQAA